MEKNYDLLFRIYSFQCNLIFTVIEGMFENKGKSSGLKR